MDEPLRKLMGLADRQEGLVSSDDAYGCGDHDRHYLVEIACWRPLYLTWDDAKLRPLKFVLHVAEALGLWPTRWTAATSLSASASVPRR